MATFEDIEREAISLPKDQRLELASKLLSNVEEISEVGVDETWQSEISRCIEQYKNGEAVTVPTARSS